MRTIAILLLAATVTHPAQQSVDEALDILCRRVAGLLRVGHVYAVDHDRGHLQVTLGKGTDGSDFLTGWILWPGQMKSSLTPMPTTIFSAAPIVQRRSWISPENLQPGSRDSAVLCEFVSLAVKYGVVVFAAVVAFAVLVIYPVMEMTGGNGGQDEFNHRDRHSERS